MSVAGLVLAAGGGRRMGTPKALLASDGEPWLARAVAVLESGGCSPVVVALGAQAPAARPLVPAAAHVVEIEGWERGMGESLRQGLEAVDLMSDEVVTGGATTRVLLDGYGYRWLRVHPRGDFRIP